MSWHLVQKISQTIVQRVLVIVMTDLTRWRISKKAVHRNSASCTINTPGGISVPSEIPHYRFPMVGPNQTNRTKADNSKPTFRKSNHTAIMNRWLFKFYLKHHTLPLPLLSLASAFFRAPFSFRRKASSIADNPTSPTPIGVFQGLTGAEAVFAAAKAVTVSITADMTVWSLSESKRGSSSGITAQPPDTDRKKSSTQKTIRNFIISSPNKLKKPTNNNYVNSRETCRVRFVVNFTVSITRYQINTANPDA